jgi:DtxR family Mn-dependent transcriptional regulator
MTRPATTAKDVTLTSTVENYLKHLFAEQQRDRVKLLPMGKLAAALGVTPGTATTMVKALAEHGLVKYEPREGVRLTAEGQQHALQVIRRHRLVELFLVQTLGLDWSEVHDEAEELEHAISQKVLERLDAFLGHPRFDPHGDPIPGAGGRMSKTPQLNLADCQPDIPLRVTRILDQEAEFLHFVQQRGLSPGARVVVQSRDAVAQYATVLPAGKPAVTLGTAAAAKIRVEPLRSRCIVSDRRGRRRHMETTA